MMSESGLQFSQCGRLRNVSEVLGFIEHRPPPALARTSLRGRGAGAQAHGRHQRRPPPPACRASATGARAWPGPARPGSARSRPGPARAGACVGRGNNCDLIWFPGSRRGAAARLLAGTWQWNPSAARSARAGPSSNSNIGSAGRGPSRTDVEVGSTTVLIRVDVQVQVTQYYGACP
jgi:hypothetical protein